MNKTITLTIALIVLLIAVLSLSYWQILSHVDSLTKASEIGQLVGGIASPLVALVSVLLLIWTLHNQQQIRISELLSRRFDHLRDDLRSLHFEVVRADSPEELSTATRETHHGADAIETFVHIFLNTTDQSPLLTSPFVMRLYFIVGSFDTFRHSIEKAKIPDYEKKHHINRISFLYTAHLMQPFIKLALASDKGKLKLEVSGLNANETFPLQLMIEAHKKMIQFIQKNKT